MAITFHCPNPACGRPLTVKDEAAGRKGKCPSCGTLAVVPQPQPAGVPEPDPYGLAEGDEPAVAPAPSRSARSDSGSTGAPPSVASSHGEGLYDDEVGVSAKTAGPAVDLAAIGLGMNLYGKQLWTWVLANLVLVLALGGLNFAFNLVTTPLQFILAPVLGRTLGPGLVGLIQVVGQMALQAILMGGAYRMALRQLDGHQVSVGDMFAVSDVMVKLALVGMLVGLITGIGFVLLIIPGLIASGLLMFTLPLVVDGNLAPVEALRASFEALKRDWLKAALFYVILVFISLSGVLGCFIGILFTGPIVYLSTAAQYRRVFAPGAKQRRVVAEDPWADAVRLPLSERQPPKMPGLAWALFVVGLLVPVAAFAIVMLMIGTVVRAVQHQQPGPAAFPNVQVQPGQLPPGFPKMEFQPGQPPPGFPKLEIQPGQAPPGFPPGVPGSPPGGE